MLTKFFALSSLLLVAAIFGFFYAYAVSAMWGLDAVSPTAAIEAMQGINASVRNGFFFPAFFLTPLALAITAGLAYRGSAKTAGLFFAIAALIYLFGGIGLTAFYNIPMNENLGALAIPKDPNQAAQIWSDFTGPWQFWNTTRTILSGIAVLFTGIGLLAIPARS